MDEDCGLGYENVFKREDEDVKMDKVCVFSYVMNVLKMFLVMKVKMI